MMRMAFTIAVFASALFGPFWLLLIVAGIGIIIIPRWFEVIGAFMLFEFLFHGRLAGVSEAALYIPLSMYVLLIVLSYEWLRARLRERIQ